MCFIITKKINGRTRYFNGRPGILWSNERSDAVEYTRKDDAEDDRSMFGCGGSIKKTEEL